MPPSILIVDARSGCIAPHATALQELGFDVTVCLSALEAKVACERFLVDVLIVDVGRCEGDAVGVLRNLGSHARAIAVAAHDAETAASKALLNAGFSGYLKRSWELSALLVTIGRALLSIPGCPP